MSSNLRVERAPRDKYGIIDLVALEDPKLTPLAKCVILYAASRPDGWQLNVDDLHKRMGVSEQKISTAFKCLQRHGYLRREKTRGEDGCFVFGYTFVERPNGPQTGAASVDSASVDSASVDSASVDSASVDSASAYSRDHERRNQREPQTKENSDQPTARHKIVPQAGICQKTAVLDEIEESCLLILRSVPGYPFDPDRDRQAVSSFVADFPGLNLFEEFRRWSTWKLDHPFTGRRTESPRLQLRSWLEKSAKGFGHMARRSPEHAHGGDCYEF